MRARFVLMVIVVGAVLETLPLTSFVTEITSTISAYRSAVSFTILTVFILQFARTETKAK